MVRNPFRALIGGGPGPGTARAQLHTATDGRDMLRNDPDGWEVDKPYLWWDGPAGGNGSGGPWGNPPPGAMDGPLGPMAARTLPAVTRCTSLICDTIAGLPWHVQRGWEQLATPTWLSDPQAARPDGRVIGGSLDDVRLSSVEFWTDWIRAALWLGDGYIYVPDRDSADQPKPPLYQFNPAMVTIEGGRYYVADQLMDEGSIIHLRGEPPYTDGHGKGVMTRHATDLGLALTVRSYAQGQYTSGVPAGYLSSTQPHMEDTDAQKLKDSWLRNHGNSRRSIAVLNATTSFTPIQVTPLDAQLDNARQWSLRDIAMAFNLPGYMLGVSGDSETYSNAESRIIELRMFSLLPWMRRIESCLDSEFPAGTELKIKSAGLERADTSTRFSAYASALSAEWMTVDEVRALEDLPPMRDAELSDEQAADLPSAIPALTAVPEISTAAANAYTDYLERNREMP